MHSLNILLSAASSRLIEALLPSFSSDSAPASSLAALCSWYGRSLLGAEPDSLPLTIGLISFGLSDRFSPGGDILLAALDVLPNPISCDIGRTIVAEDVSQVFNR